MGERSSFTPGRDEEGARLLHEAVVGGDLPRVVALLDQGVDPDASVERRVRLRVGFQEEAEVRRQETALECALRCGNRGAAHMLLLRGARASLGALGYAIPGEDTGLVRRLLEGGADPNGVVWGTRVERRYFPIDEVEYTADREMPAVEAAAGAAPAESFALLVEAGGKAAQRHVLAALERAGRAGDTVGAGRVLDAAEQKGVVLAPAEVFEEAPELLCVVLERHFRQHPEDETQEGRRAVVTPCLLRMLGTYRRGPRQGPLPLLLDTLAHLLEQGADADFFDPQAGEMAMTSPLHAAILRGCQPEVIGLLLEHGARTTFVYPEGLQRTALEIAMGPMAPYSMEWRARVARLFEGTGKLGE